MSHKILAACLLASATVSAIGCASGDLRRKCDVLTRENEDILRQKNAIESELMACRARCESLERDRKLRPGVTATPFEVPSELKGKVDIRKRGNDTVIDIPSDVFFTSGASTLSPLCEKAMGNVVEFIRKNGASGTLRVEGHSDADPIRRTKSKYHCNWELSFERSHAVMHYLIDKGGIDPHRVVCESYGEYHPADSGNKSRNRRVEIVIAH